MDLLFVWCLVIVADHSYNSHVVSKLDEVVGAMSVDAVVDVWHDQDWTQGKTLRNTSVEDDGGGCGVAHPEVC